MKTTVKPATLLQAMQLLNLAGQKDASSEKLQKLFKSGLFSDLLDADLSKVNRDDVRRALLLEPLRMEIIVDYELSLAQMIEAGQYDWFNDGITAEKFPIVGEGIIGYEVKLFHFGKNISSEDAESFIGKEDPDHPWMSAKIEHLLAFGAAFPDMQRKFPIAGLSSSCEVDGDRYVPILREGVSGRYLDLSYWDGDWHDDYRFLAVRTLSSDS